MIKIYFLWHATFSTTCHWACWHCSHRIQETNGFMQRRCNSNALAMELHLNGMNHAAINHTIVLLAFTVTKLNKNISFSWTYIDGLVQERRNSIANAMELRLSCTNLSIWQWYISVLAMELHLTGMHWPCCNYEVITCFCTDPTE